MLVAPWHPAGDGSATSFATHLHGRDLAVTLDPCRACWHWRVASPHGVVLAEGDAPDRAAAEQAAEDEATAVHPPTTSLLERLLT
jgi:hypothetical protein